MNQKLAEEMNYWSTAVHPSKSQAEIIQLLEEFGATNYQITQGQVNERFGWLVRFEWLGHSYRFVFAPLGCKNPEKMSTFGGKKRRHQEQAKYQMGRIAVYFTKAILTSAEYQPKALLGFMELPYSKNIDGSPLTAGEIDTSKIASVLLLPESTFASPDNVGGME